MGERGSDQMSNMWKYRDIAWSDDRNLVGYDVEAADGRIGTIDEATAEADTAYIVVDTGAWISGKKRVIPAGLVTRLDHDERTVRIALSKDQVRAAPDWEDVAGDDEALARYAEYYGPYAE
jgi:hypothetical protein